MKMSGSKMRAISGETLFEGGEEGLPDDGLGKPWVGGGALEEAEGAPGVDVSKEGEEGTGHLLGDGRDDLGEVSW
jgi:hypothetical protein